MNHCLSELPSPFQIELLFFINLGRKNLPASQEKTNEPHKKTMPKL